MQIWLRAEFRAPENPSTWVTGVYRVCPWFFAVGETIVESQKFWTCQIRIVRFYWNCFDNWVIVSFERRTMCHHPLGNWTETWYSIYSCIIYVHNRCVNLRHKPCTPGLVLEILERNTNNHGSLKWGWSFRNHCFGAKWTLGACIL